MEKISPMDPSALSPHVASLIKSISAVPPAAVPAIIDCVLASSDLSPPQLFSALLHSFPDLNQAPQLNHIISHTSALCHLTENPKTPTDAIRQLIWRIFVPALKAIDTNDLELVNQIEGLLFDVVNKRQSWELMGETLVPYCLRSVGLSVGIVRNDDLAVYEWGCEDFLESPGIFPLPVACRVLIYLINYVLESGSEVQTEEGIEGLHVNLMWDLSNLAVEMLMQTPEARSFSVRFLLPAVFKSLSLFSSAKVLVHGVPCILSRSCFAKKVWKLCMSLFSSGHVERLDAYNVISLYFSSFYIMDPNKNLPRGDIHKEFDVRAEKEFWVEIRRGLVDKDACLRKQALHILKVSSSEYSSYDNYHGCFSSSDSEFISSASDNHAISSNGTQSHTNITKRDKWAEKEAKSMGVGQGCHLDDGHLSIQERWKVFILLYEMLEEYVTHLVEAAWTHQIHLLFQSLSLNNYTNPVSLKVYQLQMETIEGLFSWLAVLWERGFFHENPQVRCLIMQSFLTIDWKKYEICAQKVPKSFVVGPLVLGLNDVVHHMNFGARGIYTSRTIKDATNFFCELSCQFSPSERVDFLWSLASVAKIESFGRAGLMALVFCIASAACKSDDTHNIDENHNTISCFSEVGHVNSITRVMSSRATDLLDVLGVIIERSKQHFNPNYRRKVCEQIIKAAASVINIYEVSLEVLLHFLSTVPREFTDCAGQVRATVQQWLTQNSKSSSHGSFDTEDVLLENLVSYAVSFLKHEQSRKDSMSFDDEDVDAWKLEVRRWARVLFLVIKETSCLEPIFKVIQNHCSSICKQDYKMNRVSLKILVLIQSLVEELQIELRKFVIYDEAKVGRESRETQKLDISSFLVTPSNCEEFVGAFLLLREEIASFSTLVSPIFWSGCQIVDSQVPCSIKGKLGGPSLRRLAPQTTAYLLQAIMSIRTLACISSWFSLLNRNDILDSSFTFSWEFSWKVIQSRTYKSETGAELCLGGYEALAYVFKAWSMSFNMSAFDFILSYNKSHCSDGEGLPLLDPLVLSFLHNINDLLANGVLTRSRRAVLMNWKWHCLGSLLSIPYNVVQNKVYRWNPRTFFSDSTVRSIFADIVESLENAGENSVLNILRSVRFVIGLLCPASTTSVITSLTGVNCQMMYQLTQSSWILHLSCNKRRVAHIAALLSATLHQTVFSDLRMHETSGTQPGPLKWFIAKLLDEGVKSPRTIRLAALHLTGLWLLHPKTLKYYIQELKLLSLYGSVAFDEDFEAELHENQEARTEVSLLAQSPDSELTELFINTELYARVSVAVLFHRLANLPNMRGRQETEDSLAALHVGKMFLLELLDSAVNDKDIAKELYKKYSAVHRRKVRAWQMICILSNFVANDIVNDVTAKLHICLYRNNLPAVRQYLETFSIQVYLKFPALAEEQLIPIFYDYNMKPQALSSYVFIATNVIIHASDSSVQMKHLNELLPPMIPFLTSHHHSLRGFTQLLVHYALRKMWPAFVPATSTVTPLEKKCFEDLKSYLTENVDCKRLRTSMEGFLDAFDPNTSVTPAGVFSARNEGSEFECAPISLMGHVITFLNDVRDDLRNSIANDAVTIENESLIVPDANKYTVEVRGVNTEKGSRQTPNDSCLDFQKKITMYENARPNVNSRFHSFLSEMENEDQLMNPVIHSRNQAMAKIRESQQQFVLVASLVDRIPNLAGLARTCEVFKAAGLAIPNASIVQDKQFQLISVTAAKWVPIIEVPVSSMKIFLEKKRQEGFSILGLEQTANSTPLDKYSFPKKTVLVLGREKEGIPVDIIHILDACIEIPQLGIIRSLNVHVSGAIALWEYTRQQRSLRP